MNYNISFLFEFLPTRFAWCTFFFWLAAVPSSRCLLRLGQPSFGWNPPFQYHCKKPLSISLHTVEKGVGTEVCNQFQRITISIGHLRALDTPLKYVKRFNSIQSFFVLIFSSSLGLRDLLLKSFPFLPWFLMVKSIFYLFCRWWGRGGGRGWRGPEPSGICLESLPVSLIYGKRDILQQNLGIKNQFLLTLFFFTKVLSVKHIFHIFSGFKICSILHIFIKNTKIKKHLSFLSVRFTCKGVVKSRLPMQPVHPDILTIYFHKIWMTIIEI